MQHEVSLYLRTSGLRLDVWDGYAINLSMLSPGSPWAFSLWRTGDLRREAQWNRLRAELAFGERVFVAVDGAVQLNGYIEDIEHVVDPDQGEVLAISGRDLSGPALKWHADPRLKLKGLTLLEALTRLFAPLGITVRVSDGAAASTVQVGTSRGTRSQARTTRRRGPRVDHSHPRPGETVWQVAEAICRRMGLLLWCAPDSEGNLVVVADVPDYRAEPLYAFTRRGPVGRTETNILRSQHKVQVRDVPTEVTVYSEAPRGDTQSGRGETVLTNSALTNADRLGGWRVNTLLSQPQHVLSQRARTKAAALRMAERTLADANARLRTLTITVQGHGQVRPAGQVLYAVNTMAAVECDRYGLSERMLLTELSMRGRASEGQTTAITLTPQDAIQLTPEDDA